MKKPVHRVGNNRVKHEGAQYRARRRKMAAIATQSKRRNRA